MLYAPCCLPHVLYIYIYSMLFSLCCIVYMLDAIYSIVYAVCCIVNALCSMAVYALCSMLYALCSIVYAVCCIDPFNKYQIRKCSPNDVKFFPICLLNSFQYAF